jgi:hypothetical protein
MALSYICEFNLKVTGSSAEKYLTRISRQWPALYADLKGVRGTLLLANAFGLAGPYSYLWRVDIDSYKTLQVIDDALKSSDQEWRKARSEWFENRTEVRARLLNIDDDTNYLEGSDKRDGLVHFVLAYASNGDPKKTSKLYRTNLLKSYRGNKKVHAAQHLSAVLQPSKDRAGEVWARLANLDSLEAVASAAPGGFTSLYGELREVNGALIAGA